jgi:hypothetical protein
VANNDLAIFSENGGKPKRESDLKGVFFTNGVDYSSTVGETYSSA